MYCIVPYCPVSQYTSILYLSSLLWYSGVCKLHPYSFNQHCTDTPYSTDRPIGCLPMESYSPCTPYYKYRPRLNRRAKVTQTARGSPGSLSTPAPPYSLHGLLPHLLLDWAGRCTYPSRMSLEAKPASCRPQQLNTDDLFRLPRCQCPTQPASLASEAV
jgi:hypothetical protein